MLIKELASAVALDYRDRDGIDDLVGREALTAGGTLSAALYARSLVDRTGIEHTGILRITNGTFHLL
jgi:hypothetical protein